MTPEGRHQLQACL